MSNKVIMMNPDDIPSAASLKETIERLENDIEIFTRVTCGKKQPNLNYLRKVVNFLDILYKRKLNDQ